LEAKAMLRPQCSRRETSVFLERMMYGKNGPNTHLLLNERQRKQIDTLA
jgi:hypothetical protein